MIKKYEFNGLSIDKWIHQNNAVVIDFLDGCLLDNMLLQTGSENTAKSPDGEFTFLYRLE